MEEIIKTDRKFATASILEKAIDAYVSSLRVYMPKHIRISKDEFIDLVDEKGRQVKGYYYHQPPTIEGLCLFLGISKKTWWNYCAGEENADLHEVCEKYKLLCVEYYNTEALKGTINQKQAQFNLEANYGWRQTQEIELGKKTREAVSINGMSMAEKLAMIKTAAKDID